MVFPPSSNITSNIDAVLWLIAYEPYNADRHVIGNLTLDKFIVDFDFDIRDVAFDTKERFEMLCVFDNPTPRFSANEVSDIRDP